MNDGPSPSRKAYGTLRTAWADTVSRDLPLPEHPRPQLVRENWINLNGRWDFAVTPASASTPATWDGEILVPFPIESQLSGVQQRVGEQEALWYRRSFVPPADDRVLLHFGAVDWRTTVWVNGREIGSHQGGYTPFSFDITEALNSAPEQELIVRVWDPTDSEPQPRGKQVHHPELIFYTPITGIWQTVWLEGVPSTSIADVLPQADIAAGLVRVTVHARHTAPGTKVRVVASDGGIVVGTGEGAIGAAIEVPVPSAKLWTPDTPHLYDLEISLPDSGDTARSYFAMREVSRGQDRDRRLRLFLNGAPIFHFGPLDQGYWPDGLYTAPCDEALRWDLARTREMGFNAVRKHAKVEPARWYRHADELGLLVWQDMPSGFGQDDQKAQPETNRDIELPGIWKQNFRQELKEVIDALRFFPCISVWVPFNEGWGQHDTNTILQWVAEYDPERIVGGPSGWEDLGWGHLKDKHAYPDPAMFPAMDDRVSVLGEFGGLGLIVNNHLWQEDHNWGYQSFTSPDELLARYKKLIADLSPLVERGLGAAIYTQTTDVEIEINGLITYDRSVIKMPPAALAELHRPLLV